MVAAVPQFILTFVLLDGGAVLRNVPWNNKPDLFRSEATIQRRGFFVFAASQ